MLPSIKFSNMNPIKSCFTSFFYLACWLIAIILTVMQVVKYYENEDLVDIKYKSFFDKNAHNNYPSFSICMATFAPMQFNESKLPKNIRSSDLFQMFSGDLQDDEKIETKLMFYSNF